MDRLPMLRIAGRPLKPDYMTVELEDQDTVHVPRRLREFIWDQSGSNHYAMIFDMAGHALDADLGGILGPFTTRVHAACGGTPVFSLEITGCHRALKLVEASITIATVEWECFTEVNHEWIVERLASRLPKKKRETREVRR